ncbi:hypothetical protein [Pseudomonas sp. TWP3-2]|uniref:hypothetical protein n=1 Tax=Pseudomonas sp. TWP3-2 TaxID=2804574 RepID=UPI003CF301A3
MRPLKNKAQQIETSIASLIILFEKIITAPKDYVNDQTIRNALKSQGGIAKLHLTSGSGATLMSISPMSLTTLKSKISTVSDGQTFESFDRMRIQALDALDHASLIKDEPKKQTKIGIRRELEQMKIQLEQHRETNFRLLQALSRALAAIESVRNITDFDLRAKRARDESDTIAKILTLNEYPFNKVERPAIVLALNTDAKS